MLSTFERIKELYTFINSEINKHYPSAYVWNANGITNGINMPVVVVESPKREIRYILFKNLPQHFYYTYVLSPNTFRWNLIEEESDESKLIEFIKYLEEISTVENIEKAIAIYKLQKD